MSTTVILEKIQINLDFYQNRLKRRNFSSGVVYLRRAEELREQLKEAIMRQNAPEPTWALYPRGTRFFQSGKVEGFRLG